MAEKGKIRVINDGSGGIVVDKKGDEYQFNQPNHRELCLNSDDAVKFDLITLKEGSAPVAVNVERLTAGTITALDASGFGRIEENKTLKPVNFFQPFPAESGIKVGDVVRYSLICTAKGELAVNLTGVGE